MTTSLVTGGAGFIGAHMTKELLRLGHDVVVLDDLSGGFRDNVDSQADFVSASILDHELVNSLFLERQFDYVYHCAAYAAEGLSHFIKRFNYNNNLIGSVNLINASVNTDVKCFVFTSSIAVYGSAQVPMVESMRPEPEDSYGIAKHAVECELAASYRMFGLPYVIFRPHNVYGELQNIGDRYRNVLGIFINQILRGEPLSIFGDGEQKRAFTYVRDIVPSIASAPTTPGARNAIFNVGSDAPRTVNDLSVIVREAMDAPDYPVVHHPARDEVFAAFSDHSRVQEVFQQLPSTDLEDGVRRMVEWAAGDGPRDGRAFDHIEIERNLPSSWRT